MGSEIKESVDYVCRTCLTTADSLADMVGLFDLMTDTVANMYINCTSLPAQKADGISAFICCGCYKNLVDFHTFRMSCIESYNFLSERKLGNHQTEIRKTETDGSSWSHSVIKQEQTVPFESMGEYDGFADAFDNDNVGKFSPQMDEVYLEEKPVEKDTAKLKKRKRNMRDDSQTAKEKTKMICDICQKVFYKKHRLESHIRNHMGLKNWVCEHCDKEFAKWSSLKSHISYVHAEGDEKVQYKCDFEDCGKIYSVKSSLISHKKTHSDTPAENSVRYFVCEQCGKPFKSNSSLQRHAYTHAPELMPFKCTMCDKKYPTNAKLQEHILRHKGIKNHVCPICGQRRITGHDLRVHMNVHTKEKQYPCEFCSKIFYKMANRSRHIKVFHCGVKNYKCEHCDRSFGKAETLKHHTMTHTGEKPHKCTICDKRFIQQIALKTHMKTHNKAKY